LSVRRPRLLGQIEQDGLRQAPRRLPRAFERQARLAASPEKIPNVAAFALIEIESWAIQGLGRLPGKRPCRFARAAIPCSLGRPKRLARARGPAFAVGSAAQRAVQPSLGLVLRADRLLRCLSCLAHAAIPLCLAPPFADRARRGALRQLYGARAADGQKQQGAAKTALAGSRQRASETLSQTTRGGRRGRL
jgi:hypothetical protein